MPCMNSQAFLNLKVSEKQGRVRQGNAKPVKEFVLLGEKQRKYHLQRYRRKERGTFKELHIAW